MLSEEEFIGLSYMAEGNVRLVEEAIIQNMKFKRDVWWKFWTLPKLTVNKEEVMKYIVNHRYDKAHELSDNMTMT